MENNSTPPRISVVVNYFNPKEVHRITLMTLFCMECVAAYTASPLELMVVDGSGKRADALADECQRRGWIYQQCPDPEFSASYNQGAESATGDYIVWLASDIFVVSGWEERLIGEMRRTGAWMAMPYLTNSDYPSQVYGWVVKMRTFRPSSMTFNLNVLSRQCYQKVGPMDVRFTGAFNDMDYLIRMRRAGGDAIVVDCGQICHLGRATTNITTLGRWYENRDKFLEKYPEMTLKGYPKEERGWRSYDLRSPELSRSRVFKTLISAAYACPIGSKMGDRLVRLAMRLEPLLHEV